jgi:hypothetical protein
MKSSEFITEAVNTRSYNKSIVDALKAMGFKVDSREQSAGALKTWLNAPNAITLREIVAALTTKFPGTKLEDWDGDMDEEIRGQGFQIEKQSKASIFLAVYAGPKADEYAMGLDEDEGGESIMADPDKRQARLKAEIKIGMIPIVYNVTRTTDPVYTMGDLEDLGWMDKEYTHDLEGEVDGWIRYYDGPGLIRVATDGAGKPQILKPGEKLD